MAPLRALDLLELHPPPDWLSDEVRRTGEWYEAAILDELATRLAVHGPCTIVDGGAMLGNHSVYLAAHLPMATVHAFEPVPANLELLYRNAARWTNIIVHPVALSDRPGTVHMRLEAGNLGHSLVDPAGPLVVQAVALDSLALENVVLLKIDLEGHEGAALRGAWATLMLHRPLVLIEDWQLEYGRHLGELGYALERAWPDQQTYLWAPVK